MSHNPPPPPPPNPQNPSATVSPPHFENPLIAPRPYKLDPGLPANMARNLDDQISAYRGPSPHPPPPPPPPPPPLMQQQRYAPGFNRDSTPFPHLSTPAPPPGSQWSPWSLPNNPNQPPYANPNYYPQVYSYQQSPPSLPPPSPYQQQTSPPYQQPPPPPPPPPIPPPQDTLLPSMNSLSLNNPYDTVTSSPKSSQSPPSLTAPLPTIQNLNAALPAIQQPNHDPALKIAWARDVLFLVDRLQPSSASSTDLNGPARISDPQLLRLAQVAVQTVVQTANSQTAPTNLPPHVAEAIYLRATFASSGAYPDLVQKNPRVAFRDFEAAARAGYAPAWFRLGRDYESFEDFTHAKECFERGVKLGVESCCYRMGMAHLMGQLNLPKSIETALPLLQRAATLASLEVPQPAYIYALILFSEFNPVSVPTHMLTPLIPPGSSPPLEARKHLERAAYLNFPPSQYKLGHVYEFAQPPFPFDALLSVQYYSLASQQGEVEADMALSKWFLCGAEGAFEKDEGLAYTFAEKAARKGLPSAEFAMGYYAEVGVGRTEDLEVARKWYTRAADHGNSDAAERLAALSQPAAQPMSRKEHDVITENKLVRKRTQAKQRSEAAAPPAFPGSQAGAGRGQMDGRRIVENIRKNSLSHRHQTHPSLDQQQQQQQQQPQQQLPPSFGRLPVVHEPQPRPQPAQLSRPQRERYSLTDPGSGSASPVRVPSPSAKPPTTGGRRTPGGRRPSPDGRGTPTVQSTVSPPTPPSPPLQSGGAGPGPSKGSATTFAELGFQGGKVEEEKCVIM